MVMILLRSFVLFVVTSGALAEAHSATLEKSDLRILFVGHDPEAPRVAFEDLATGRTLELYKERTGAFDKLLRSRFKNVRVVHSKDYTVDMSDSVDVTVFDARPKEMAPSKREIDPSTGETVYEPAKYLPMEFSRPALLISENSPLIGESIGLKLDWL